MLGIEVPGIDVDVPDDDGADEDARASVFATAKDPVSLAQLSIQEVSGNSTLVNHLATRPNAELLNRVLDPSLRRLPGQPPAARRSSRPPSSTGWRPRRWTPSRTGSTRGRPRWRPAGWRRCAPSAGAAATSAGSGTSRTCGRAPSRSAAATCTRPRCRTPPPPRSCARATSPAASRPTAPWPWTSARRGYAARWTCSKASAAASPSARCSATGSSAACGTAG